MVIVCPEPYPVNDALFIVDAYMRPGIRIMLSDFQKWAIKAIVDGDNVLITAHTGSGKTLPAEFAINYFAAQKKKVIYASPIKALSNQKLYDMRKKFPHISFGILTGDCKDNPEADVLIMTTEILRNTLLNKKINKKARETHCGHVGAACGCNNPSTLPLQFEMDFENELAMVVFDEVHYINDAERGSVWEQAILMLPPQVQLLMLSATIDRPQDFAGWIEEEKKIQKQVFQKL
jgi:superfamily II RNA helicase